MMVPSAIDILKDFVGAVPKKRGGDWCGAVAKWRKYETAGRCCFCRADGKVYDVAADPREFGLENFTSYHFRAAPGVGVCLDCLRVLKEAGLQNSGALYMIEAGSRARRDGKGKIASDNVRIFEIAGTAGKKAFLARLLDRLPDLPFICGWKQPKSHVVPFSPVNMPGCRVVQVFYQPAASAAPAVIFFDRERHRQLVAEAERWWSDGHTGDLMEAYRGTLLLKFVLRLTNPGSRPKRKSKKSR